MNVPFNEIHVNISRGNIKIGIQELPYLITDHPCSDLKKLTINKNTN
jgi:hypothetical protein